MTRSLKKIMNKIPGNHDKLNQLSDVLAVVSILLSCCAVYDLSVSLVRDRIKQIAVRRLHESPSDFS